MKPQLRVLSLGAGVQSTAVLLMAARGEFDTRPDVAIFADTGWEPQAVYHHLEWLEKEAGGAIPILRVSAGNIRHDVLQSKDGKTRFATMPLYVRSPAGSAPEGVLRRQCTREYKIEPITRKIRELLGLRPRQRVKGRVEQWFGISLDEITRVKDNRYHWIDNRYPLIEKRMTRWDCILWLRQHGYPTPPKSSCIGCPYHGNEFWRQLRDHSPEEWQDAVEFDRQIRTGLKGVLQDAYVHRSLVPLDQVDLSTPEDRGQMTLAFDDDFDAECEGMCGV